MQEVNLKRRAFLGKACAGFGLAALGDLMAASDYRHHAAKAKRVIFLYQAGGPSHLETFDSKPKLAEMHGKTMPESFTKGQQICNCRASL